MKKLWAVFILLVLTGCQSPSEFLAELKEEWSALLEVTQGRPSPLLLKKKRAAASPSALPSWDARTQALAEKLLEMHRVVLRHEPVSRKAYLSLVDSLLQGASFEGVIRGFVSSPEFRAREVSSGALSAEAFAFFTEELARTEVVLHTPTVFTAKSAQPAQALMSFADLEKSAVEEIEFGKKTQAPTKQQAQSDEELRTVFQGVSKATAQRVLSEELMQLIQEKSFASQEALPLWYAQFVLRTNRTHVDFGLSLRQSNDESFHRDWVGKVSADDVLWEVINRVYRIIDPILPETKAPQTGA